MTVKIELKDNQIIFHSDSIEQDKEFLDLVVSDTNNVSSPDNKTVVVLFDTNEMASLAHEMMSLLLLSFK